jgi:hypothetical protein
MTTRQYAFDHFLLRQDEDDVPDAAVVTGKWALYNKLNQLHIKDDAGDTFPVGVRSHPLSFIYSAALSDQNHQYWTLALPPGYRMIEMLVQFQSARTAGDSIRINIDEDRDNVYDADGWWTTTAATQIAVAKAAAFTQGVAWVHDNDLIPTWSYLWLEIWDYDADDKWTTALIKSYAGSNIGVVGVAFRRWRKIDNIGFNIDAEVAQIRGGKAWMWGLKEGISG